tara:strand:- start:243 stop:449 length:207 start_codon:yes stop_codon:yes gene_type:complete
MTYLKFIFILKEQGIDIWNENGIQEKNITMQTLQNLLTEKECNELLIDLLNLTKRRYKSLEREVNYGI